MKKVYLFITSCLLSSMLYGQQVPMYTQYYINPFIYNPGFTGTDEKINGFLIQRSQWSNIPGSPVTSAFSIDAPVKQEKIGIGINGFNDVTGITSRFGANVSVSYKINFSENAKLLLGASSGILDNRIGFSKVVVKDVNEQSISTQSERKTTMDATLGTAFVWKKMELGFAVPQVMGNSMQYVQANDSRTFYLLSRHYLASAKYTFDINKEKNITAYPLVLVRSVEGAPLQYDINTVLNWKDKGWVALVYKNDYAVCINLGIRFKGLSIGYAYDVITSSSIGAYSGGSQEIIIGYSFGDSKKDKKQDEKLDSLTNKMKEFEEQEAARVQRLDSIENQMTEMEESNQIRFDTINDKLDRYKTTLFTKAGDIKAEDLTLGSIYRLPFVNFESNSAELNKKALNILDELVNFLYANPTVKIDIHGHTDDVGGEDLNLALSNKRATSVLDYLLLEGIDKDRLTSKGFGETKPLVQGKNDKAKARNRRTEFVIIEK